MANLTESRIKSWATLAVALGSTFNAIAALSGHNALPFTDDQIAAAVSATLSAVAILYAWWHNNDITESAVTGTTLTHAIKADVARTTDLSNIAGPTDQQAADLAALTASVDATADVPFTADQIAAGFAATVAAQETKAEA